KSTERYTAPGEPGPIQVLVEGTASPEGSRLQLGSERLPIEDGRWKAEVEVPLGQSRFELTLTDPRGFNVLHELSFHLADVSPEGEPLIVQPGIPELEVRLPSADAPAFRGEVRVRGRAALDTRVLVNGERIEVNEDGGFDLLAALDPETRAVEVVAIDEEGRRAEITRSWEERGAATATGTWVDAEPFVRLIHSGAASEESTTRMGLAGVARFTVQRLSSQGPTVFAAASAGPADRLSGSNGSLARADVYGGVEAPFGRRFVAALRYEGAVFTGGEESLLMRHDAGLSAMVKGSLFDIVLDTGFDTGPVGSEEASPLAGAGLGFRLRAGRSIQVRARAGALLALAEEQESVPEIVDASAQVIYRSPRPRSPSLALGCRHVEDGRAIHPEAAGDLVHLTLAWPAHDRVRFLQTIGGWAGGAGSFTGLGASRLEVTPTTASLLALDYRLLTQLDRHEHAASLEGAYLLLEWLRLGAFYRFTTTGEGGETSSRLQARLQASF
ncbi:MAG: hypothetical protein ACOC0J_01660, partial [Myxococcota bacterium]